MNTDRTYAESLASEYAPKDTRKVVALKKLDKKAKSPAVITTYTIGVISALVLGLGMCLSMGVIGSENKMIPGVVIGLTGIVGMSINYPLYKKMLEKGKKKYAAEITELAKEIIEADT